MSGAGLGYGRSFRLDSVPQVSDIGLMSLRRSATSTSRPTACDSLLPPTPSSVNYGYAPGTRYDSCGKAGRCIAMLRNLDLLFSSLTLCNVVFAYIHMIWYWICILPPMSFYLASISHARRLSSQRAAEDCSRHRMTTAAEIYRVDYREYLGVCGTNTTRSISSTQSTHISFHIQQSLGVHYSST